MFQMKKIQKMRSSRFCGEKTVKWRENRRCPRCTGSTRTALL